MFAQLMDPNTYTLKSAWDLKRHLKNSRASSQVVTALLLVVVWTKTLESFYLVIPSDKRDRGLFITKKKSSAERMEEESASDDHRACESDSQQSMKGYKYIVCICSPRRFITIDQIWDCCGNSADGKALKDMCLSCALFWRLLTQRYFGEVFQKTSLRKDHDFVFKKLLPSEGDFKRAFRIIEVELGFCYDFFFTKYHYTFQWMNIPMPFTQYLILLKVIVISIVLFFAITKSLVLETPNPIIEVHISDTDYIITLLVLVIAFIVELVQKVVYLASNWAQVSLACMRVEKYWCAPNAFVVEKVTGFLRKIMISGKLRNKINQHSVIFQQQKQPDPVEVSDAVKRAVARSLISTYGNLGETPVSRQNQMFDKFSWALKDLSRVEVMLIWHIATEYCDVSLPNPSNGTTQGFADNLSRCCPHLFDYVIELLPNHKRNRIARGSHQGVAVHMSRYCTYLIGSVPDLLPYHKTEIAKLAQRVMEERTELFGSYSLPEIYNIMENLEGAEEEEEEEEEDDARKIFQRGVKLGKQLKSMPDGDRWEMLEDFWAETIIHAATSLTTTKQHMQHLENGGEFLTHIWALLSHAGILNVNRVKGQER